MSVSSIPDAGIGRQVPLTRRSAIRTGTIAALAAGLLGTAGAAESSTVPTPTLAVVVNFPDLMAESRDHLAKVNALYEQADNAFGELRELLTDEQWTVFHRYYLAAEDRLFASLDQQAHELGRHFPGLYGALWAVSQHMHESPEGVCCLPDGDES